ALRDPAPSSRRFRGWCAGSARTQPARDSSFLATESRRRRSLAARVSPSPCACEECAFPRVEPRGPRIPPRAQQIVAAVSWSFPSRRELVLQIALQQRTFTRRKIGRFVLVI